jgi:alpha-L-arabinofuranosidase
VDIVGLDEFVSWCRNAGTAPIMAVNTAPAARTGRAL